MALFSPSLSSVVRVAPISGLADRLVTRLAASKPSLAELLATAPIPWTLPLLAAHLDVAPQLLERVQAGRQPLPRRLAARMADAAGLAPAAVEAVVPEVVDIETPVAYVPAPADPCYGERLDFIPLARTVEVFT